MKVLILNRQQVKELLPMRACMVVLAEAFKAYSRGDAVQPLRTVMKVPGSGGVLASMPGYDGASEALAVKLITVFHNTSEGPFDSHQGLVALFSSEHGNLLAIMDAIEITAIRTAAASGVAQGFKVHNSPSVRVRNTSNQLTSALYISGSQNNGRHPIRVRQRGATFR